MAQTNSNNISECLVSKEISTQEIIEKLKSNTNANVRNQNQQSVESESPKIVESQSIKAVENRPNKNQSVEKHSEENLSTNSEVNQKAENTSIAIQSIPYQHKITLYLPIPSLHPPYTRNRLFYGLYKHLINLREI